MAELLLSILLSGALGTRGIGVGRVPPLILRRGRGDPASDEDDREAGSP